jgi:hypothetical protein
MESLWQSKDFKRIKGLCEVTKMQRGRSWKNADCPNRRPAWQKMRIKDPLKNWIPVGGFANSKIQAEGMARGIRVMGNKNSKRTFRI